MLKKYEMVVGLEVHAELSTQSKIYCSCKNKFGLEVNSACCPVCTGMPGTLPTLNEKVVDYAIKMGCALHCKINHISKQDRKNYFYPDLPKAYQISQFDVPLCENGHLDVITNNGDVKRVGITRIHIEEDAGKLLHDDSFGGTLVDFNRCGVPLIEIVSEPDLRSSAEARCYLETIRSYLIYLGISDAKMQEGSVRCDVNVSARLLGNEQLGTRCEMKNVNTFSGAVKAIDYEFSRQIKILESGGVIEQETRRWDEVLGQTVSMRSKENAQDYRYFPEPDLKTIVISQKDVEQIQSEIPEMPNNKAIRYMKHLYLQQTDAILIVENVDRAILFEQVLNINPKLDSKSVANWILGDITKIVNETGKNYQEIVSPQSLADLIQAIEDEVISNAAGKKVFSLLLEQSKSVGQIIEEQGLSQISDADALKEIVTQVLQTNQKSVSDYKSGKTNALGFLVGQCMKATKGKGNPSMLKAELLKKLS